MYLFKRDIFRQICQQQAEYQIKTGELPTDIVLSKDELQDLYHQLIKDWGRQCYYSGHNPRPNQHMISGMRIHAEKEGNTDFNFHDYK